MVRELTSFFGLSLKHGTIIIGITQSVLSFMFMILSAVYADNPRELIDLTDPSIVPDLSVLKALLVTIAIAGGIHCVLAIVIIFAAEAKRPLLLLPWLIYNPLAVLVYLVAMMIAIIHHSGENCFTFAMIHITLSVTVTAITAYKIMVVHSYYKHLRRLNF